MRFKLGSTEVKVSFSFFALVLLLITTGFDKRIILVVSFAILHEIIHLTFINKLSMAPKRVYLNLFGADILRGSNCVTSHNAEILIHLSAPLFNLLLSAIFFMIRAFFIDNVFLRDSAEINLIFGIFNLIPFYNFDGGNALNNFILKFIDVKLAEAVMTIISVVITAIFSIVSVWLFVEYKHNTSMAIISGYMIFSIIFKK